MIFSRKTWKLFIPILFMVIIMFLAFYSRDLLKYGNRNIYPITTIVDGMLFVIMAIGVVVILFLIDIFLNNYLQELKIIQYEKEINNLKKGEK